ncbi:efflux RND transporter periplasmic adaptor subunit [Roseomonas sp. CECT 9278]|uniref:efflux RND transporter periplasmic adaptor subunit n=1 Tax=Roseomonas sp. CECT 9278 TaxID=2845823 RepID=UPI001E55BF56|nr:efflux RND transporter periplasmic adaptor subunit [Roseomonas sp. CECT 9278]CAH0224963.1 Efflux pump periplasmic linker BepF [Roseomonas sp. CECT 9278]
MIPNVTLRSLAGAFALLLAASLPAAAQFGPQGPPAVGVQVAERRPITETIEFVGRVEATDRVNIRARVTGFLQERLFREGGDVTEGEVLYRLERAPFQAQVEQAQANLAGANATLENTRVALSRARELRQTGTGTQVALDNALALERTAAANVLAAEAAVRVAQINLGYTEITAPIAGQIGRSVLAVGNVVGPDAGTLSTIVSQDPMRVAFAVSQRTALELRNRFEGRGGPTAVLVRIRTTDGRNFPETGRIDFVDNQIDRNTDTILVRALIPNPIRQVGGQASSVSPRELVDGQFVSVTVEGAEPVMAITLPRAAVLQDQQGAFVFVVGQGNVATRRNVTLGRSTPERAVIEGGLQGGETVVVEGLQRVRPGQPVNPAPVDAPPPPRPTPQPPARG